MIKTIEVNKRLIKAFVLSETDKRLLYIPLKSLHYADYKQLKAVSDREPDNMLEEMRRSKHTGNNRNLLAMYDGLINVLSKAAGNRSLMKSQTTTAYEHNEMVKKLESGDMKLDNYNNPVPAEDKPEVIQEQTEEAKPKRRGRPPKSESQ